MALGLITILDDIDQVHILCNQEKEAIPSHIVCNFLAVPAVPHRCTKQWVVRSDLADSFSDTIRELAHRFLGTVSKLAMQHK